MLLEKKASELSVKRLPVYLRVLDNLIKNNVEFINSKRLSEETGFTAALIRKDLSFFGAFGTRGRGYYTETLRNNILKITGLNELTNVIVVGAGNLGIALTRYNVTKNPYIRVIAVFDINPAVVGGKIIDVKIFHVSQMKEVVSRFAVDIAILTVPPEQAQTALNDILQSGVKVISNFVPVKLHSPEDVYVHNIDISFELQSLRFYTSQNIIPGKT